MARMVEKLSPTKVQKVTKPGLYGDGAGLWLHVGPTGGKSWVYRFMLDGTAREMGLGPLHTVGLAEARRLAAQCRRQRFAGVDPLAARRQATAARRARAAKAITFKNCAAQYIAANRAAWRNAKHGAQWGATLATYAYPVIGDLSVADVDTGHVTRILETIWTEKPETASRVRGRIEAVLDYAGTHRWREGENPARWRGHLEDVLPDRSKVRKAEHHAALPWSEIGVFMADLERQEGVGALALRFAILTAARTGEVIGARWAEIDMQAAIWTVPEERTKAAREHRVPIAEGALAVLREAAGLRQAGDPFVFPGAKKGKSLSNMAMLALLRRMGRGDFTSHGFRSTFRDWSAETTGYQREVVEAALAHAIPDKVEAAYRRGDLFEKRLRLMGEWAEFCGRTAPVVTGQVLALRGLGASPAAEEARPEPRRAMVTHGPQGT
jgi:integrase